jgi:hypothetical protein
MKLSFDSILDSIVNAPKALPGGEYQKFAEDTAIATYGKAEEHNQRGDAMRHILYSAQVTKNVGKIPAMAISFTHETSELFDQPKFEKEMDYSNDAIGRRIAGEAKTKEDMVTLAKKAIDTREAKFYYQSNMPDPYDTKPNWGTREDGTQKGNGWLGPIPRKDGTVMTEVSEESDGILYPLLVPTLTQKEIDILKNLDLKKDKIPDSIREKAIKHAHERMKQGKSPFAD